MRRLAATSIAFTLAWAFSIAARPATNNASQTPSQSSTPAETSTRAVGLPKGTRFIGELKTKIDSKHAQPGQAIVVEVSKDVKSGDQVLLSKGSLIKGTITQVQAFSKGHSGAELDIVLDTVAPKNEQPITNHFAIFALSAKLEKQPDDINEAGGKGRMATSASISGQVVAQHDLDLTPQSNGIFGFTDVELHPLTKMAPPTAAVNSSKGNIVLDNGTRFVLESVGQ